MLKFDHMETELIKIDNNGPTDTAVIGEELKNDNYVVVVLTGEYGPKSDKEADPEKSGKSAAATGYPSNVNTTITVSPYPNILERRIPVGIAPPAGTPKGRRAVGIWDKNLKKLVIWKDKAIDLEF